MNALIEGLDFTSLLKARTKFEQFRQNLVTDEVIAVFEGFSRELAAFLMQVGITV